MDKKNTYKNILLNAYNSGLLKIVWNTSGFSIGIDPQEEDRLPELKEKEFREYTFSIIKIVADMADGKKSSDISEDKLKIAREIYNHEKDLKNHLFVKRNSKIRCFRLLETQIISYRNDKNPKEIEANSAIIKLMLEKDDDDISEAFEISRRDLGEIIDGLIELKEKMDSI